MTDQGKQSDLSKFGFVSYCPLPRQTTLDSYFPKDNAMLDILLQCIKEQETETEGVKKQK